MNSSLKELSNGKIKCKGCGQEFGSVLEAERHLLEIKRRKYGS